MEEILLNLGKTGNNKDFIVDLQKTTHFLISGVSGCGKSTLLHNILMEIIKNTKLNQVKLLLIDTTIVELGIYSGIPNLLIPPITKSDEIYSTLDWLLSESTRRIRIFSQVSVDNIEEYNNNFQEHMFHIIVAYEGYIAELVNHKEILFNILSTGKQVGIHFIVSTCTTYGFDNLLEVIPSYGCFWNIDNTIPGIKQEELLLLAEHEMLYSDLFLKNPILIYTKNIVDSSILSFISSIKQYDTIVDI